MGLRGLIYTELEATGAKVDLHSGMYGGVAPNPFFALIQIIAKLKDEHGKILIPHFYDRDDEGMPHRWIAMMKRSIETLVPRFSSDRMVAEYVERIY